MESRKYSVAEIVFEVILEEPWRFLGITPAVQKRIDSASRGEKIGIEPCRAGDAVPARTFIKSKDELPEGMTRFDLNFTQYEPFRTEESNPAFTLKVCAQEPSWIEESKLDGSTRLVMSVEEQMPRYFIYRNGNRTLFEFEAAVGNVVCSLLIDEDATTGELFPKGSRNAGAIQYQLCTALMVMFTYKAATRGTLLMHSSVIRHDGMANMFLGTSGTGKSTHSRLWLENIEGCDLVNDDNPAIKISEDGKNATVYGTPWSGKTPCYRNISVPLRSIVRLSQAPQNSIKDISGLEAFITIISSASAIRWDRKVMDGITKTAEKVANCTRCCQMGCLPDADAAFTCLNHIEKR